MGLCLRDWFSFVGSVILACVLGVVTCWVYVLVIGCLCWMVFPGFSFLVFWIVVGSCRLVLVGGLLILVGLFAGAPVGCFGLLGCCCGVLACVLLVRVLVVLL